MSSPDQEARRRERWMVGSVVLVALFAGIGGGVALSWVASDGAFDPTMLWITVAVSVGMAVVAGGIAVAFVAWRRRRGSALFARSPLWELPFRERNALVRALRRGDPIAPERRDLARRAAADFAGRRALVWLYLAVAVAFTGNALLQDDWSRWLWAALVLLYLGLAGYFAWLIRRMRLAVARLDADAARGSAL